MYSGRIHDYHLAIQSDFREDPPFLIAQSDSGILKVKLDTPPKTSVFKCC